MVLEAVDLRRNIRLQCDSLLQSWWNTVVLPVESVYPMVHSIIVNLCTLVKKTLACVLEVRTSFALLVTSV